ncbi:carcinoembryonic antigen-related cell adhesion molecule 7-like isoform X2 [Eleutherodactylus coqui]|uniref:carcinoembryonic antigen-related cell adhesion molecule 7-like isoform X2 n=1 Tax=Eleutherodactylus coqui TaxID=57060 RepID=UPI003461D86A
MRANMIAVLILHMDLISGEINIQLNPENPIAKESVTLKVTGITGNILYFYWCKGPSTAAEYHILTHYQHGLRVQGPLYFSRVTAFPNGSLLIKDLQVEDQEIVSKPVIIASYSEIKENDFATLTCVSANADRIKWIKSSSETINLENVNTVTHDNGTIVFSKIKRSDEGKYECQVENRVSRSFSEVYLLKISSKENEAVTQQPYGSTSASLYIATPSDSIYATIHDSPHYKNAGITAGIICGAILGILLIIAVSFFLYKRYGLRERKDMAGTPTDGPDQYAVYDNILDPTTGLEPKDEPLYMCLQFSTEGTYNELHK